MKKAICIILTALILASALYGCAEPSPTAEPTATPDATPATTPSLIQDVISDLYADDTLMFTVEGSKAYWPEFLYWANSYVKNLTGGYLVDWSMPLGTESVQDYVVNSAVEAIALYRTVEAKAAEMGIVLSDEDKADIENEITSSKERLGGQEAYEKSLAENCLTESLYRYMLGVSALYYHIFSEIYGENGEKLSDEDALAYADENGYMLAKHIFMASGETETEDAEIKSTMEGLLAQLRATTSFEELSTLFDELMTTYSEDTGLQAYPDGYLFKDGDMVNEFKTATAELLEGEISGVVESVYGYHIILRLPIDPDAIVFDVNYTLRYYAASLLFDSISSGWTEDAEVIPSSTLNDINFTEIFK